MILSFLFLACGEDPYYSKTLSINEDLWSYTDTLDYEIEVVDTISTYDLMLDIAHSTEFAYQNLYIRIWTLFPDGIILDQTLPIDFADKKGNWYGDCNASNCDLRVILQENAHFDQMGLHRFRIVQYMRTDPVKGISAIEMMIDQRDPDTDNL